MSKRAVYILTFAGAAVAAAAVIGASVLLTHGSSTKSSPPGSSSTSAVAGAATMRRLLAGIPQHGNVLGDAKAPVTLFEYADLQCPYCARFAVDDFPSIAREYVRTGRVRVVFQGLSFLGPDSETALQTALSAGEQRRLWNVVELLFANQGAENSSWVTEDLLRSVGNAVPGLRVDAMLSGRSAATVATARTEAQASATTAGVTGTPTFAVGRTGGVLSRVAASDAQSVRAALDAALKP